MDTLVEGVIIMDEREQVLLANQAFGRYLDVPVDQLIGKRASAPELKSADTGGSAPELPWVAAMAKRTPVTDCMLELRAANQAIRTFAVNATPVLDARGGLRGALASFDDVTELRQQNGELQRTLTQLEESRQVVEKHNAELRYLASHDPLTGCLNRRAFFDSFGRAFEERQLRESEVLCCAMIDIDHFKGVNDRFGHATGDRVIGFVAETIRRLVAEVGFRRSIRRRGILRRLRFSLLLRGYRRARSRSCGRFAWPRRPVSGSKLKVTVSAGVTQLLSGDVNPSAVPARADGALYSAKAEGRDRVVLWTPELDTAAAERQLRAAQTDLAGPRAGPTRPRPGNRPLSH